MAEHIRITGTRCITIGVLLLLHTASLPAGVRDDSETSPGQRRAHVAPHETINRDYFAFGPVVTISGTVNGDVYASGGQIFVDGKVNGDLLAVAGRISISGDVVHNVRSAGGQIGITGTVGRNLTVAGGNVELSPGAKIGGNVVSVGGSIHIAAPVKGAARVAAGTLIISNHVGSTVNAAVGQLRLTSKAEVLGDVSYLSHQEAELEKGARVEGKLVHRLPPEVTRPTRERLIAFFTGISIFVWIISLFSTLILGLLSLRFLPRYHETAVEILKERPLAALGLGFVAAIVTPVACVLLLALVVTLPIALILAAALAMLLFLGRIFVISRIGEAVLSKRKGWAFIIGLVVYYVIALIPIIGWLFVLLVVLAGLGADLLARRQVYLDARARELL